jgi:hypothetical protein
MGLRHERFDARTNAVQSLNEPAPIKLAGQNLGRFDRYAAKPARAPRLKLFLQDSTIISMTVGLGRIGVERMQEQGGRR